MTRLLKLIPINSCHLFSMFLNSQGVKDVNLIRCEYLPTYEKGGKSFLFPDIEADDFPRTEEDLGIIMTYQEKWFNEFHDAIASDSVQMLLEAMCNVQIPCTPGLMLTRDHLFGYSSELVDLWQSASPVIRNMPEKPTVIKKVKQHPLMLGQKRSHERPAPVVTNIKDIKKICQDCGEDFLFGAAQQKRYKELNNEDPKRCFDCIVAKKARFSSKDQAQSSPCSQDKPNASMPDGAQAQAAGGWGLGGASGGSDGWGSDGKGQCKGKGKNKGKGRLFSC